MACKILISGDQISRSESWVIDAHVTQGHKSSNNLEAATKWKYCGLILCVCPEQFWKRHTCWQNSKTCSYSSRMDLACQGHYWVLFICVFAKREPCKPLLSKAAWKNSITEKNQQSCIMLHSASSSLGLWINEERHKILKWNSKIFLDRRFKELLDLGRGGTPYMLGTWM